MDFHIVLRELREKHGFTQLQLAETLHISKNSVSHYENGLNMPNIETLCAMADIFDVSIDYLLGRISIKTSYSKLKDKFTKDMKIDDLINELISLDSSHKNDLLKALDYIKLSNDINRNKKKQIVNLSNKC